jgi:predicted DsbA family dithiol-disulfide isomerase
MDFHELMNAKGGGRIPLEKFFEAPRQAGANVGIIFNFEQITRAPNTLFAHCLLAAAPQEQVPSLLASIYAAYFEHGQDVGDLETLVSLGVRHGLDPDLIREKLQGQEGRQQVQEDHRWAADHGISGVPFYVINDRYGVSGAQPPQVLLDIFRQVASEEN